MMNESVTRLRGSWFSFKLNLLRFLDKTVFWNLNFSSVDDSNAPIARI